MPVSQRKWRGATLALSSVIVMSVTCMLPSRHTIATTVSDRWLAFLTLSILVCKVGADSAQILTC